jgi:2-methylcitrate dehydratase PrpD
MIAMIHRSDTQQTSLARSMVRSARAMQLSDLSTTACDKLKICLLDFLSCAFEGRDLDWSRKRQQNVVPVCPLGGP